MVSFRGQIQNFRRASPSVPYGSPPRDISNHLQPHAFIVNKLLATDSSIFALALISKVDSIYTFPFRGSGSPL